MQNPTFAFRSTLRTAVIVLLTAVAILGLGSPAHAAPPDLTNGGEPDGTPTINLGATGMRGWMFSDKRATHITGESRQILVTEVDGGSPADGVLAVDDVILGADGTGATPVAFSSDARRSLALAIAEAEARNPGVLKLRRWRAGSTSTVQITLRTMGAYSATAPYNCPKSNQILLEGAQHVFDNETSGRYSFGALSLLASGNPSYAARVQSEARALIPSAATMAEMMSDERDANSMITWPRGHTLVFLAEYFLATGDTQVLPAIEAYALNIAKNQSLFGTVGHIFAEKNIDGSNNGPMGGVYGVVNSAGMPCFLGLLLARECGLTNPELEPAIERSSRFFAYYAGKGGVPYGEHTPYAQGHETNGKSGLAAVCFALQPNREEEGRFFAKMATAATGEREKGHTGAFFNYLWSPLGASQGGEEAAASHFSRISWILDLHRRWDGGFDYDNLNGEGPNSGSSYHDFKMSTAALLVYALPLRELHITGRGQDTATPWLTSTDVTEANAADDYDADSRSDSGLITDLGNWSPKVRQLAAKELGTRSISTSERNQIIALANNPNGNSRPGACQALGEIGGSSAASTLAALLTDPDSYVRYMAAESMRYLSSGEKSAHLNTILAAAASTSQPLMPFMEDDPLQFAHGRMAMLLFYSGNAYGPKGIIYNSVSGVDRNLLYPAIRAVAATPVGQARSTLSRTYDNLTYTDVLAVADAIVESIRVRAPSDKMFSGGVRQGGIETLEKFGIAEGVPLSMIYMVDDGRGSAKEDALGVLENYAGSCLTVVPDPDVIGFCEAMLSSGQSAAAQAVLNAIDNDSNPAVLTPLKSIQSVSADDPVITLPTTSTVLRVNATDHAMGNSIYTWRKVSGPAGATFTPNGTAASADTTVQLNDPPAGTFEFEVTMSDDRGLTEVSSTITVEVTGTPGPDVTNPDPDPMSFASAPAALSPSEITMTATTASDRSDVEYYFECTAGGGNDSGWQDSPTYVDSGLFELTEYTYRVQTRDKSPNQNTTGFSGTASATTLEIDDIAPTLSSGDITDNVGGSAWFVGDPLIFTLTFSEEMDLGSIDVGDFDNAFSTDTTVLGVGAGASDDIVLVTVLVNEPGTLRLRVRQNAVLRDPSGNSLNTSSAIADNTTFAINVVPNVVGSVGVFNPRANNGINPVSGNPWQAGDQYRLAFVTSSKRTADSTDINDYNAFVQGVAAGSATFPDLGNATWKVIGSTQTVNAKVNTGTDGGGGVAVVLMDGRTVIANNNTDIWNGFPLRFPAASSPNGQNIYYSPYLNEEGIEDNVSGFGSDVATGSNSNGTSEADRHLGGSSEAPPKITHGNTRANTAGRIIQRFNGSASSQWRFYALSAPLTVLADTSNNFNNWIAGYPGAASNPSFIGDPDRDGLSNGLESVFGTNPGEGGSTSLAIQAVSTGGTSTITFTHPHNTTPTDDIVAFYEWSTNLNGFHADGMANEGTIVTFSTTPDTPAPGITTVTATISGAPTNQLFIRIGAMLMP